ncbi:hypothetical protein PT285_06625 [Lactobacillus sp. ESL0791]|uniref:hypothetical protein n=1 Tax=Lactobacillus sp. ESL0791 TaxID=2983234 RepID=UPI0023F90827|nr:hypothetical protein [Lactobacillus sp. ESL0791]MDF7639074.1 hypothetical protein [Lactobacillus sp. ESL0791]
MTSEATAIYTAITDQVGQAGEQEVEDYLASLVEQAIVYAEMRANWALASNDDRVKNDAYRTHVHDSVIYYVTIISRSLEQAGIKTTWFQQLVPSGNTNVDRKRIGDFACYICYLYAVSAR